MCGLVGVFGVIGEKEKEAFKYLLQLDTTRGKDSTGVAAISMNEAGRFSSDVYKSVGVPREMYAKYEEDFEGGILQQGDVVGLIGHNRFRTQGPVTDDYAHPYDYDHVVGCHNGTISPYFLKDLGDYNYEVDSQHILASLNDNEKVQDTWGNIYDNQTSAAALTWWDKRKSSLNLIRNTQRPLNLMVAKDKKSVFWASEKWMLIAAAVLTELEVDKVEEVKPHLHIQFSVDAQYNLWVEEKALEKKDWAPTTTQGHGGASTITTIGSTTNNRQPKMTLRVKTIAEKAAVPHVVFVDETGREIVCTPTAGTDKDFLERVWLHSQIYPRSGIEVGKYLTYNKSGSEDTFISAYQVEISMQDDLSHDIGKRMTMDEIREMAKASVAAREKEKAALAAEREAEEKRPPFAFWVDNSEICGKAFRRALRAAGNVCAHCQEDYYPSTPGAAGGYFIASDEFYCGSCVKKMSN